MFILKKGHQPGVYVPLRALFLVTHLIKHTKCTDKHKHSMLLDLKGYGYLQI